jgi:hypothetical protein
MGRILIAVACLGLLLAGVTASAQQIALQDTQIITQDTYAQHDQWRPSPEIQHMSCATGNCGAGGSCNITAMPMAPVRRPMYTNAPPRSAEWPIAQPAQKSPQVAQTERPVKECNCTGEGSCKCDPAGACKCDPAAIAAVGDRLTKIEASIAALSNRPEPEPLNVDHLADAIQQRLTLPVRVVDDSGKQVGDIVHVPLNNETPLSLRLKAVASR